ncbi:citryl-CoA lyase [Aureimonas frigidaquae]|uniref:citrate synthase (unknown stereospecificity) n=1 Tax=Aureimonas frigidaquae TaxID=424757 RepID=A0A0P0Z1F9_9HYPH|nr:citryl-CoA lyase [Aureimonas frigidaquae]BAT27844.1 citrate synthase [Aureimonas frigidaquae]
MSISTRNTGQDWWSTAIVDMAPGTIRFRGYAIEELIGTVDFPGMIWLMLRGELPKAAEAELLGTALMAGVDHGPQAPSIAIARMASTCGIGINNAMASATNVLGDVHGGAGEQCVALFEAIAARLEGGEALCDAVPTALDLLAEAGMRYVPGYGHRFHPVDPRAPALMAILRRHEVSGTVRARFADIAEAVGAEISRRKGRTIPLNIDGATGAIYAALGFPAPLCRGLFVLSRSVGAMAHAWEEMQQPHRNKGPLPRHWIPAYTGVPPRPVPGNRQAGS